MSCTNRCCSTKTRRKREGGFARFLKTPGSYARFFDAFLDDDDAADGRRRAGRRAFSRRKKTRTGRTPRPRENSRRKEPPPKTRARARRETARPGGAARPGRGEAQTPRARARRPPAPTSGRRSKAFRGAGFANGTRRRLRVPPRLGRGGGDGRPRRGHRARRPALAHFRLGRGGGDARGGVADNTRRHVSRPSVKNSPRKTREPRCAPRCGGTPDKFDAKMGGLIVEADRDRVREVNVVARIVAALFQEARERT